MVVNSFTHGVDFWKSQGKPGKVREFNFTLEKSGNFILGQGILALSEFIPKLS